MPRIARSDSVEVKRVDDMRRSTIKRLQLEKEELQEALQRAQTALEERPHEKKDKAPINWDVLFPENNRIDINKDADSWPDEKRSGNDSLSEVEACPSDTSDCDDPSSPSVYL